MKVMRYDRLHEQVSCFSTNMLGLLRTNPVLKFSSTLLPQPRPGPHSIQGKRVFIKDLTYYLLPPDGKAPKIAPSLHTKKRGIGTENGETNGTHEVNGHQPVKAPFPYDTEAEIDNPTIVPKSLLEQFHFTFLIRDPHSSIPSWFRCTVPPLDEVTGFYDFYPNEAGYDELRRFFEFLCRTGQVGPDRAGSPHGEMNGASTNEVSNGAVTNGEGAKVELCVVDADELLDDPEGIMKTYCESVNLDYTPDMLNWDNEEDQTKAVKAFEKWKGFHDDAIDSKDLKPRAHVSPPR